ncbi:hypothetical protein NPJ82_11620 [Sphingomonas sp. NY01]|uniref:hypothetical protein n=1 Tax=Sphingomonas sp. NY01 TaxID=2968057 RepID=UPI00315DBDDE
MARDTKELTDTQAALRRTAEMAAVFMIGDGLLGLLQPERHVALWRSRTPAVDLLVRPFAGRPTRRRLYGALQLAAGLALAARQRARDQGTTVMNR